MSTKINKYTPILVNGQVIGMVTEDTFLEGPVLPIGLFFSCFTQDYIKKENGELELYSINAVIPEPETENF